MATLDTDLLRTFLAVERTGSFTRAGDSVSKTQSAVSMQIKRLEEQLGERLFVRGARAEITAAGRRLLPHARTIVDANREALAAFDPAALSGAVALGTADDYAERYLPAILAGFSEQNPLVELSVLCASTHVLQEQLAAGNLDVAIVTHDEVSLHSELLRTEPLFWVASRRHHVHEESVLPLALGSVHCSWRRQALHLLERSGRAHKLLYASSSATVVSSAVLAGLAVSVLPESAVRPDMRVLDERDGMPSLSPCHIGVVHGERGDEPVVRALMEHIRSALEVLAPRAMTERPEDVPLHSLMEIAGRKGHERAPEKPQGGARPLLARGVAAN